MHLPRVKICCISSIKEMNLALKYRASAIGLVSDMPSGPGVISDDRIRKIVMQAPPAIGTFLLTSKQDVASIIKQQRYCKANTIQIVDDLIKGTHKELIDSLPGISIVQVIHVNDEDSIDIAKQLDGEVHGVLLDSGNQKLAVKELGGTGRTHDWSISKKIVESLDTPVFLAGGLNPDNVTDAIKVKSYGLDMCSGVRTNGDLDEMKLQRLFKVLNQSRN